MLAFINMAYSMMDQLWESLPGMADEWMKISEALDQYSGVLRGLDHRSRSEFSHSSSQPNGSSDAGPSSSFTAPWEHSETNPEVEFGDWYFHRYPPPKSVEPINTYWNSGVGNLQLPEYVADILVGWVQYGQAIAWDSFNTYCKVFTVLSLTAKTIFHASASCSQER